MDGSEGQNGDLLSSRGLEGVPDKILDIIRLQNSSQFLDSLASSAMKPELTLDLFTRYESVFADTCARWISDTSEKPQRNKIIAAFARILPLAPFLATYLYKYLSDTSSALDGQQVPQFPWLCNDHQSTENLPLLELQWNLLSVWRLINFDSQRISRMIPSYVVQTFLGHRHSSINYLAVRILCQLLSASDAKLKAMLKTHVGNQDPVMGDFDGQLVDYGFLSLFEEKRLRDAHRTRLERRGDPSFGLLALNLKNLSPLVVQYGNVLLPRPNGPPGHPSSIVLTGTTAQNMGRFALALLNPAPILLHGLAGSSKTSLANDFARELSVDSTMVTLHLNEQTDAKMLIGIYATGSTPGSFAWRPGVLTTAVKEGRWVLIEDLDRAPNEVISVILPLIERGELLIPSRGETIKASPGFRLLATIRTSLNINEQESNPASHMLGARLWQHVAVQMPSQSEFREIVQSRYPILQDFLPGILSVYERVSSLSQKTSFASKSRTSLGRPVSPRDLLKWSRRLDNVLIAAGSKSGQEPVCENTRYEMFMEAADCFAGSLQTKDDRRSMVSWIAEEMHISPQRLEHFLTAHIPRYEDDAMSLTIGRTRLRKRPANRIAKIPKKSRPFANTSHTKRLLEQVGVAMRMSEPVLLVGETGIGKTTVVQQLADSLGFKLTAVNLSQQSEVGDLLGGYKPVNVRSLAIPLKEEFDELFAATGISVSKNAKYIDQLSKYVAKGQWSKVSRLWHEAPKMFEKILNELLKREVAIDRDATEQPNKRRKLESRLEILRQLSPRWQRFLESLDQFDIQLSGGSKGFAFTFVEGNIVKAVRNGEWVLLDEINLASPDTLESIADLLHSGPGTTPSLLLSETGEIERIRAHPDFRIFGAMNPATDVGKRDLPIGLRSRFTEIYVESPDTEIDDLLGVIKAYLKGTSSNDEKAAHDVARLYMNTKRLADEKRLVDGANQVPHFSLRTLTRVLSYATDISPFYGLRRALYEGFAMGFLTLLDRESERMLTPLINHHLLDSHGNPQALLSQTPRRPDDGRQYISFTNKQRDRHYWMLGGRENPLEQPHYIITPFVERNMLNLVRATSTRRFPVLIQGPTSSGKTSLIEYLANFSGNKFIRINNHEHTDLQEYLGMYVSGLDGQLRFQEGPLVQALRQGHWIVLDELNLAPTDVLEALNRLLDDNRELLIPETQEIVRPYENFMLFATQNPPGLYGGRKTLSRAFRNRFLELHFDDIPEDELDFILEKRSQKVAPSDCRRIVAVYKELSRLRQSTRLFEQKDSFATLRDLFRWALRDADNREQLAANGYMLLAERVRNPDERSAVKEIIERVMKVKVNPDILYDASLSQEIKAYNATSKAQGVVWTKAMRRLYILVAHALRKNEPVLLVGETGCGKTTVCQMLADAFVTELHILNAHQNTETGDLIGAQRPIRNRTAILDQLKEDLMIALKGIGQALASTSDLDFLISVYHSLTATDVAQVPEDLRLRIKANQVKTKALFEWSDGALVQAMKKGQFFLLDEISLADDSVLERLNSVLDSQRKVLLAEKGIDNSFVEAAQGFQFFATMNPGGDYGKRELSPALRNRFTEIWVPSLSEHEDVFQIVEVKLDGAFKQFSGAMVEFAEWFSQTYRSSASASISVRDVLAWVKFMNECRSEDPYFAILHGAAMVYIDTLGANPTALLAINPRSILEERAKCLQQLSNLIRYDISPIYFKQIELVNKTTQLTIGEFSIAKQVGSAQDPGFALSAPTTKLNAMRILRALQVQKPILLEGNPGVGKTTLISALALACGRPLTRINLSERTDLMDLFGSDVPVEGAEAGHFAWRDAPFLQAMQKGEWILLDEMNLASQSVLEGLNACLDHRGEVYISELDQKFKRHPCFSVFAAQNPHHQGGGRKGLPSSFVNRFTVVYADVFKKGDFELICKHIYPALPNDFTSNAIQFVERLEENVVYKHRFGSQGGPWEFNLRDILRWLQLFSSIKSGAIPSDLLNIIFRQRFRTNKDRQEVENIFTQVFGSEVPFRHLFYNMTSTAYQVGSACISRNQLRQRLSFPRLDPINRLSEIESIMICLRQNLPCILVSPSGSGKTTLLQHVAAASGHSLVTFHLNADIDTMDLVGGFEQVDPQRASSALLEELNEFLTSLSLASLPAEIPEAAIALLELSKSENKVIKTHFEEMNRHLCVLADATSNQAFIEFSRRCQIFVERSMNLGTPRFEWVDGILVKALEEGKWLVLDNANLCSASVLDRLNSLLEPNGFLSINEHCGNDGEPKIVRPHPDFRIFLTMDPRYGELSRAMRNRAIEIFLEPLSSENSLTSNRDLSFVKPEASLQRFQRLSKALEAEPPESNDSRSFIAVGFDHLSWADLHLLPRYAQAMQHRLILKPGTAAHLVDLCKEYMNLQAFEVGEINLHFRQVIGEELEKFGKQSGEALASRDAQMAHPLQNSPLVPILQKISNPAQVLWFAASYEFKLDLIAASSTEQRQQAVIEGLKPTQMNRLQRSMASDRIPLASKDSTVRVADFLKDISRMIYAYLKDHVLTDQHWQHQKTTITAILQFWWDTYRLVTASRFDEATFLSHLTIGFGIIKNHRGSHEYPIIHDFHQALQNNFETSFKLTTGLSMEILWKQLRPVVVPSLSVLQTLEQMEQLAVRFDALRWKTTISIAELGNILASLVRAYCLVSSSDVNGETLVQMLNTELEKVEATIGAYGDNVVPYFADQFEAVRQAKALAVMRSSRYNSGSILDIDTTVLANHPTTSEMQLSCSTQTSLPLQSIGYLLGNGDELQPIEGSLSTELLHKLCNIGEVDLRSLKLLEAELPILGQKLALSSEIFRRDQLGDLNQVLLQLVASLVTAHGEEMKIEYQKLVQQTKSTINFNDLDISTFQSYVRQFLDSHTLRNTISDFVIVEAAVSVASPRKETAMQYSALAWVSFAMIAIQLYVPDRAFDPDKRQCLERQRHEEALQNLHDKLEALKSFERLFTGQESNFRCQLLEEEIAELGEPPEILQHIYRPEVSELDQLQGDFKHVLSTVLGNDLLNKLQKYFSGGNDGILEVIKLLQSNIRRIIHRLSERFRAYHDLTAPAISMLRCLQVGLLLALKSADNDNAKGSTSLALTQMTPFLGGPCKHFDEKLVTSNPMEVLSTFVMTAAVEKVSSLESNSRQLLFKSFHLLYEQWNKRLEADRVEAESKTGLYRFRGNAEDEEEDNQQEFDELFPTYDNEPSQKPADNAPTYSARDTAIETARMHSKIFLRPSMPSESIYTNIRRSARQVGHLYRNGTGRESEMTSKLLPGAVLLLNDQIEALSTTNTTADSYNFYNDPHLLEIRKLVNLIHQIQARFRDLQAIDEIGHMQPLEDVLISCRELLQFRHTEPLAKMITKVEKIHGFMHEWQFGGWASRANSCQSLYDSLTSMIVSWRRLELSTWAKLFEMESRKCDDDARSWWFIAYQVVVAVPLSMTHSEEDMRVYAGKLLQDLEAYFSTAILGQFEQRSRLLSQLKKHLELLADDFPLLSIIHDALTNFVTFYSFFEKPVCEHLKRGRTSLEKAMRDVLLLASWKDMNINALRDSAKRSHHKLFKIVRKFRTLLGQPMESMIKQGLPDASTESDFDFEQSVHMPQPIVDQSALALCTALVPGWADKPKRFINVSKTVDMMRETSQIPELGVEGSRYLTSFLSHIVSTSEQLRKATPSILSDENKDAVKHLKSRKRKLFADVLKELRQLGIKYNLGDGALAKHNSLSAILSNTKPLISSPALDTQACEYYFQKAIDLAPRAREASRQHSDDLSGAEVTRSIGFLEGLLQVVLNQRNALCWSLSTLAELNSRIELVQALWAPRAYDIRLEKTVSNKKALFWLPCILSVGIDLIGVHAKFGKIDSQDIQDNLTKWRDVFADLSRRWQALPTLPSNVTSTERMELEKAVDQSLCQLDSDLKSLSEQRSDLKFIVDQIQPWTITTHTAMSTTSANATVVELSDKISLLCDSVLAAVQKYQNIVEDMPTSTEDSSWLTKLDSILVKSLKSLHCEAILNQLENVFQLLPSPSLDANETSRAAGVVFATALPILQQYRNILQQTITKYGNLHRASCKTSYNLTKTFNQIVSQGFCTPLEKSDAQDGKTEKLEGGTGLGEGEGAGDISKDIQDDENLDELAEEPNTGGGEEIEDEKDAVDMADGEMEGELGDAEEQGKHEEGSEGQSQSGDEMDEEAGNVDDLDPTAVDEKKWDGGGEEAEKDQEGDESRGKARKDEQVAAQDKDKNAEDSGDGGEEEEMVGAEQEEVQRDEPEKHDPHAHEGENLDLPDDMQLDGNEKEVSGSDDGMDDTSELENPVEERNEAENDGKEAPDAEDINFQEDQEMGSDMDVVDLDNPEEESGEKTKEAGEKVNSPHKEQQPDDGETLLHDRNDDATADNENAIPSDVQGVGEEQDENPDDKDPESTSRAQGEDGGKGGDASEQQEATAEDGDRGRQAEGDAPQDPGDETQDSSAAQPFKKLGDALERWHRQQQQIHEPAQNKEKEQAQDVDMTGKDSEFQHLQDEDAQADTQALGTATEDQAHTLEESMEIDEDTKDMPEKFQPNEVQDETNQDDVMDLEKSPPPVNQDPPSNAYEGRAGAMIKQAKEDRNHEPDSLPTQPPPDPSDDVSEVDSQLDRTHLETATLLEPRSATDAREQWTHYETITRDLSLSLTEQLRLILAPRLATKMRGDFRTGKRLNIKRIIPYIASQYRRDKIWMRRSVPSKRSYQIMLAVDDSKSMGESGSGSLAFETLVMVSKSLSMLEVGEICVVGFGETVNVAHDFDIPFSSDAGPNILQNFGFEQKRTDVTRLVRESIELFRGARARNQSANAADLWQMELIISDGVCDSSEHEAMRRLLREALEERIMMVFVVVDDLRGKTKGESVMDLKEAKFVKNEETGTSEVKIERYLDTFPFQYYLIVSDVRELPGVLAALLRQWFAEVVDSS